MEDTLVSTNSIVVLNESLEPIILNTESLPKTDKKNLKEVRRSINGKHEHKNYMEYLHMAWANHYGIIISPDTIWQIIANELATNIKDNSIFYENLFTTTPGEKQEIVVQTNDAQLLPLESIETELMIRVPTNTGLFIPTFSTKNANANFAFIAAFADAMQVYYNYSMYMCGITKVKILGNSNDWEKIKSNLLELKSIITKVPKKYFDNVIEIVDQINNNRDPKFWEDIFSLIECGSGHQVEVKGWINKLFMRKPSPGYLSNYPSIVSNIPYKFLNTGQNFELQYGLFGSNIEDNFLVPDFGYIINEVVK